MQWRFSRAKRTKVNSCKAKRRKSQISLFGFRMGQFVLGSPKWWKCAVHGSWGVGLVQSHLHSCTVSIRYLLYIYLFIYIVPSPYLTCLFFTRIYLIFASMVFPMHSAVESLYGSQLEAIFTKHMNTLWNEL